MCLICGQEVQFFAGVPTGGAHPGTLAIDTVDNYAVYVYNAGWQLAGSAFAGGFNPGGGVMPTDYQAVKFFNGVPTGGAPQGTIAFDTSTSPYNMYVFSGGWQQIGASTSAALTLLSVCGPNVLFGATCDPPAGVFPKGTLFFPTPGGCMCPIEVYNGGWQCVSTGAGPVTKTLIFDDIFTHTIMIPVDWNDADNLVECLGAGGNGGLGSGAGVGGSGGGGGAYARAANVALPAGVNVNCAVGGDLTQDSYLENGAAVVICRAGGGANAVDGGAPGAGGVFLVGDSGTNGGNGGNGGADGGGGGGGAAGGPLGNGGNGGDDSGGGGGANGGGDGTAGTPGVIGGNGGAGDMGPGGIGTVPGPTEPASPTPGGGGGGGAGSSGLPIGVMGQGGAAGDVDTALGPVNGCGGGGGGGGGGVLGCFPNGGGQAGAGHNNSGGGGGGGSGAAPANPGPGGSAGTGGVIKLTWTP